MDSREKGTASATLDGQPDRSSEPQCLRIQTPRSVSVRDAPDLTAQKTRDSHTDVIPRTVGSGKMNDLGRTRSPQCAYALHYAEDRKTCEQDARRLTYSAHERLRGSQDGNGVHGLSLHADARQAQHELLGSKPDGQSLNERNQSFLTQVRTSNRCLERIVDTCRDTGKRTDAQRPSTSTRVRTRLVVPR